MSILMKLLVIFLSFVLQICLHGQTQYRCSLPLNPNDGVLCLHDVSARPSENKCMLFIYGGCGGNENRFDSVEECEDMCLKKRTDQPSVKVAKQKDARCFLPLNPVGPMCNAFTPSFGYDQKEDRCVLYIYSGCGGNANRFEYIEECEEACLRSEGDIQENVNLPFNVDSNAPEIQNESKEVIKEDENQIVKEYMPLKAETGLKVKKNEIKATSEKIITIAQGVFLPEIVTESSNLVNSNELEKGKEHEGLVKEDKIEITHYNSISKLKAEKGVKEKINEITTNLEIIKPASDDSSQNIKEEQLKKNMHKDKHTQGTISMAKYTEEPEGKIFKLSKEENINKSVNGSNVITNQKMNKDNKTKHYKPEKVQVKLEKKPIIENTQKLSKKNITITTKVPPKQNSKKNGKNRATTIKKDENKLNTAEQKNIKNVKNKKLKKIKLVGPKENITNGDKFHNNKTLQANEKKGKNPSYNKQDEKTKILNKNENVYKKTENYKAVISKHKSKHVEKYEPSKFYKENVNNHNKKSDKSSKGNDIQHILSNNIHNENKSSNVHKDNKVVTHMEHNKIEKHSNNVKNNTNVKITHKKNVKHNKNTNNKGHVKKNETSSNGNKDYISKASHQVNKKKNIKLSHLKKKEKVSGNAKNDETAKLPKVPVVKKNIKNNTHTNTPYKAKVNKSKISKIHKGLVKKNEVSPIKYKGKDKFLKGTSKKAETAKFQKARVKNDTIVKIPYKTKANKNEKPKIHKGGTGNGEKYRSVKINEKLKAPHKEIAKHSNPKGVKGNAQIKKTAKVHKVSVKNDGKLNKVKKHEKSNKTDKA